MSEESEWVAVAIVGRPHSLRGAVSVKPLTRDVEEFISAPLKKVTVRRNGRIEGNLTIISMAVHRGLPLLQFREVGTREAAENLRGVELVIPESDRWELPDGQFYFDEIEGCVLLDENSIEVGTVLRMEEGTAHDFIVFQPAGSDREIMLPYVEAFVHEVDLEARRLSVTLPEGLIDL